MHPHDALASLGGWATADRLAPVTRRRDLAAAVAAGTVLRCGRGRYALPDVDPDRLLAWRANGALAGLSAASSYRWSLLHQPSQVELVLPPGRADPRLPGAVVRRAPLTRAERLALRTAPARTVVDCAARLPFVDGLAVADSALRERRVDADELHAVAGTYQGPGAAGVRAVARAADGRAANAFESAVRGHLLHAGFTTFVPQLVVTGPGVFATVDLGDPERRVAVEADGYAVHGTRHSFAKDLRRHDSLAAIGWVTLRFAWEHVLREPGWVVDQVRQVLRRRRALGVREGGR